MKKALKELIDNAPAISSGDFSGFMFVSNGTYDGFWGKNGYDNIVILAKKWNDPDDVWYKLADRADKFDIFPVGGLEVTIRNFNLDIPSEYGVPRIWFDVPVRIDYEIPTSNIFGQPIDRRDVK